MAVDARGTVIFCTPERTIDNQDLLGILRPKETIFVDGSPISLGAVLTQEEESSKEVTRLHYASCPLTPAQLRYPQIELEALSIY